MKKKTIVISDKTENVEFQKEIKELTKRTRFSNQTMTIIDLEKNYPAIHDVFSEPFFDGGTCISVRVSHLKEVRTWLNFDYTDYDGDLTDEVTTSIEIDPMINGDVYFGENRNQ